jgi:predicted small integral membrane protein
MSLSYNGLPDCMRISLRNSLLFLVLKLADWIAIDTDKLAAGIIVVEHIVGCVFLIAAFAISAFNYMYAIVFTIKKCVNITQIFLQLWLVGHDSCCLRQRLVSCEIFIASCLQWSRSVPTTHDPVAHDQTHSCVPA